MEKKGIIIEMTLKFLFAAFSFIAAIFVVKNIISMSFLLKSFSYDETKLYDVVNTTHIGLIFNDIGIFIKIDGSTVLKVLVSFIANIEWIGIIFLLLNIYIGIVYFIFIKWKIFETYLKMSGLLILTYLLKYLLFACSILLLFKDSLTSISLALIVGTIVYILLSLFELTLLLLWMIKFIINIKGDIKYYYCIN